MNNRKQRENRGLVSLIGDKTPSKMAGLTYSVIAFSVVFVSLFFSLLIGGNTQSQWALYLNYLAAPIAFLISVAWYFLGGGGDFKEFAREQKCSPKYYIIALLLQIGLLSLGELNTLFLQFLERFGYENNEIVLPNMEGLGIVGVFIVIAVLPAFMEEFFFRGVFLREMKDFSVSARILLCGGLFALYHQNPAQTVYQFVCGAAFALVAVRAGSFLPTVLSHFINNGAIVILYKLGVYSYPKPVYIALMAISVVCLAGSLVYLLFIDGKGREKRERKQGIYKQLFVCAGVGILMFLLTWLFMLFAGF